MALVKKITQGLPGTFLKAIHRLERTRHFADHVPGSSRMRQALQFRRSHVLSPSPGGPPQGFQTGMALLATTRISTFHQGMLDLGVQNQKRRKVGRHGDVLMRSVHAIQQEKVVLFCKGDDGLIHDAARHAHKSVLHLLAEDHFFHRVQAMFPQLFHQRGDGAFEGSTATQARTNGYVRSQTEFQSAWPSPSI